MIRSKTLTAALIAMTLLFMAGCSGIYPYKSNLDSNLAVKTKTESGSLFTSIKARVDVYSVDKACKVTYLGSVDLKKPEVTIGLPANNPTYLNFIFSSSSFLANSKGSTGFDTYFKTRNGYEYIAEASYIDGIYDVILKEKKKGNNETQELEYRECKPE